MTTYGSSTSAGPRKTRYASAAERSVPQSQTRPRTKRSPDLTARSAGSGVSRHGRAGGRIIRTATAEAANEAASTANATPVPTATSNPPIAGPASRSAMGRTNWSSEFAAARSSGGSKSGTMASNAGMKNALAAPYTADERHELPEPQRAGEREDGEDADCERPHAVCGEHHEPAIEAVADDARPARGTAIVGHGHPDADERERRRCVPEGVRLPGDRDQEDPVAEQRHRHPCPQHAEVAVAQRREKVRSGQASGSVECLVTMLHRIPAAPSAAPIRRCSSRRGTRTARGRPSAGRSGSPGRARSPDRCSHDAWSACSMPSATTSSVRFSPSAMIAAARASLSREARNERSILRISTGNLPR